MSRLDTDDAGARQPAGPLILAVSYIVLALVGITTRAEWLDESSSLIFARLPTHDLLDVLGKQELPNGLYYLLLRGWGLPSDAIGWLRGLNVVVGGVLVAVLYDLARRLYDRRVAFVAGIVLIANASLLIRVQEARGYLLAALLMTTAVWCFVRATTSDHWGWRVGAAVAATTSAYAHTFGLFSAAVLTVLVMTSDERHHLSRWTMPAVIAALGCAPVMWLVLTNDSSFISWIPALSLRQLAVVARRLVGDANLAAFVLVAPAIAWGLVAMVRSRRDANVATPARASDKLVLIWLLVPSVLAVLASIRQSLLVARYFTILLPPLSICIAVGLDRLPQRVQRVAMVLVALGLVAGLFSFERRPPIEDWPAVADALVAQSRPGDAVIVYPAFDRMPFDRSINGRELDLDPVFPAVAFSRYVAVRDDVPEPTSTALRGLDDHRRVWLVTTEATKGDPDLADLEDRLAASFDMRSDTTVDGLVLSEYAR